MKFKIWFETDAPGIPMINKGSDTPASDEVKRTGLQPQVDAQEIETKQKKSQDKVLAIDGQMKRFEVDIPQGDEGDEKVNKFKKLWEKFKKKWDEIKMKDDQIEDEGGLDNGLADTSGDSNFVNSMQQHPNMVPPNDNQMPAGPGNYS